MQCVSSLTLFILSYKGKCRSPTQIVLVHQDFREKNTEHMRPEMVSLLRSSQRAFLRHLVASNPIMLFRWGILRATIRILSVFKMMGRQRTQSRVYSRFTR